MQGATVQGGLDEVAMVDRPADVIGRHGLESGPQGQVRRGRFLCLEATDTLDGVDYVQLRSVQQ